MRTSNFYSNAVLFMMLGISNGAYSVLHEPLWGAQVGLAASLYFTFAPFLKLLYTDRLFPRYVHCSIGGFYCAYHGLQWYRETQVFEDAKEDGKEEYW